MRPAFARARARLAAILLPGAIVGLLLGLTTTVVTRWGSPWFAISLGVVVGVMMVCYVAVPARLIGVKPVRSRREKLTISAVGGAMGALVSTPPYVLGRVAILMLGSRLLLIPGIVLLVVRGHAAGRRNGRGQGGEDEHELDRALGPLETAIRSTAPDESADDERT